jgi:hypothetical protein
VPRPSLNRSLTAQPSNDRCELELVVSPSLSITAHASGVIIATFKRSGEIVTGSFEFENPTEAELARRRTLT